MGLKRTVEFRQDAVRIALISGLTRKQVADDLGVGMSTPNKWITAHRDTDVVSKEALGLAQTGSNGGREFDQLCANLGIKHRLTPPRSSQTNGMVETLNGRIEDVLQSHHFRSGGELDVHCIARLVL